MSAKILKSPFKDVPIPVSDVYSFIFDTHLSARHRDLTAIIDPKTDKKYTYGHILNYMDRFVAGLYDTFSFQEWNVVGIFSPNHIDYASIVFGTLKAKGTITTINPTYTLDEVVFQLTDSKAQFLITHKDLVETASKAAAIVGIPPQKLFVFGEEAIDDIQPLSTLLSTNYPPAISFSEKEIKELPAFLCYSSGTTGRSKGVKTSHYNMVSNLVMTQAVDGKDFKRGEDVFIGVLPFFHMYGLGIVVPMTFMNALSIVIVEKFEFEHLLHCLSKYKVTLAHVVPPMCILLAKSPLVSSKYDLSNLRMLMSAAAPLGVETSRAIKKRLNIPVKQGYGMTELSPISHLQPNNRIVVGSVGVLVPNMKARIVDAAGKDVSVNSEGELWVKGPNVMLGYLNNDKATSETIDSDHWLHTGDIAKVDRKGNFYIVDRLKELIKYKGLQIAPAELEAILLTHPAVADCAVIPIPNEMAGEVPRAYVTLQKDAELKENELFRFIAKKVAPYKKLRGGVVIIEAIPKSPSGKILRRLLRDRYEQEKNVADSPGVDLQAKL